MTSRTVDPSELDENMTDETKRFVTNWLATTNPRAILAADIKIVRKIRDDSSKIVNGSVKYENIEEKEFFVKNENDGYEIPVTAYIPNDVSPKAPIVVFLHGGGWIFCSRKTHHHSVALLAQHSKCIWLSVEYRLAPEFKHPFGLEDCLSVVKWTNENKTSFLNADQSSQVGVSGDSAGGNFAATISHELKLLVSFQILIYPCVHINLDTESKQKYSRDCYVLIGDVVKYFITNFINDENDQYDPRVSPILYKDFTNLPKALIIAAELDPIYDHSPIYHQKLLDNNISSEFHVVKGVHHGFFNLPGPMSNAFGEVINHVVNFLNKIERV